MSLDDPRHLARLTESGVPIKVVEVHDSDDPFGLEHDEATQIRRAESQEKASWSDGIPRTF
jgi:hypothetical protein